MQISKDHQIKELHAKNSRINNRKGFFANCLDEVGLERRKEMVDRNHQQLSIVGQYKLLKLNRASFYYSPVGESKYNR